MFLLNPLFPPEQYVTEASLKLKVTTPTKSCEQAGPREANHLGLAQAKPLFSGF